MKRILIVFTCCLAFIQCSEKNTTFLITENSVGALQKTSPVNTLEAIFAQDSIVKDTSKLKIGAKAEKIMIYEKGGKHLLTLTSNLDSVPTIGNIRIFDSRYTTDKGIGLNSTFKEILNNYSIKKTVTTLNSVVIFPKHSNLYFTIDKEELPSNLRYTTSNIETVQIPDNSKIKYLMLGWD